MNSFVSVCVADTTLLGAPMFHSSVLDETWSDRCAELTRAVRRLSLLNAQDALLLLRVSFSAPRVQHLLRCSPSVYHFGLTSFDATFSSALSQISNMDISDIQWLQAACQFDKMVWVSDRCTCSHFPPFWPRRQAPRTSRHRSCCRLERTINTGLVWYLEKLKLITSVQSGFRKQRSTTDQLVRLEIFVREAFVNKQHAVAIFFDLEKAYDTTWKYGILKDLFDAGLPGRLPIFIENFLKVRQFQVRLGTHLSTLFDQKMGVPQGSILFVTLFALKINLIVKAMP